MATEPAHQHLGGGGPLAARERIEFKHITVPAHGRHLGELRDCLRRWLTGFTLSQEAVSALILAVNEAATNAIQHAYSSAGTGTVELAFWTEPGAVCIEISDHGHWRRPVEYPVDRGHGISFMRSCVDAVLINYGARGTRVHLWQALRAAPTRFPVPEQLSMAGHPSA